MLFSKINYLLNTNISTISPDLAKDSSLKEQELNELSATWILDAKANFNNLKINHKDLEQSKNTLFLESIPNQFKKMFDKLFANQNQVMSKDYYLQYYKLLEKDCKYPNTSCFGLSALLICSIQRGPRYQFLLESMSNVITTPQNILKSSVTTMMLNLLDLMRDNNKITNVMTRIKTNGNWRFVEDYSFLHKKTRLVRFLWRGRTSIVN